MIENETGTGTISNVRFLMKELDSLLTEIRNFHIIIYNSENEKVMKRRVHLESF